MRDLVRLSSDRVSQRRRCGVKESSAGEAEAVEGRGACSVTSAVSSACSGSEGRSLSAVTLIAAFAFNQGIFIKLQKFQVQPVLIQCFEQCRGCVACFICNVNQCCAHQPGSVCSYLETILSNRW